MNNGKITLASQGMVTLMMKNTGCSPYPSAKRLVSLPLSLFKQVIHILSSSQFYSFLYKLHIASFFTTL